MSVVPPNCCSVLPNFVSESHISYLPSETLLHVFSYLDPADIAVCIKTCKRWREVVNESETIWKLQCFTLKDSIKLITDDRNKGYSWKETFQHNYGSNGIKQLWRQGTFSNPRSYNELPDKPFCKLDTESWGEILQWELERS